MILDYHSMSARGNVAKGFRTADVNRENTRGKKHETGKVYLQNGVRSAEATETKEQIMSKTISPEGKLPFGKLVDLLGADQYFLQTIIKNHRVFCYHPEYVMRNGKVLRLGHIQKSRAPKMPFTVQVENGYIDEEYFKRYTEFRDEQNEGT